MTARVSPTESIRADIDELFGAEGDLGETLEQVARLGARLLLQSALEAEITEFLGRNRYERRALAREARAGSRNGFAPLTVKTTAGPITLERPKLRGTDEAFASRLLGAGVTKTNALESLVIAGFVRGLSVRDVEAALAEALGPAPVPRWLGVREDLLEGLCPDPVVPADRTLGGSLHERPPPDL
ncbi:MAG: transposase, partial [Actinomycetota bacterium]|nr:transposase [Actinomycetota bacterium]